MFWFPLVAAIKLQSVPHINDAPLGAMQLFLRNCLDAVLIDFEKVTNLGRHCKSDHERLAITKGCSHIREKKLDEDVACD